MNPTIETCASGKTIRQMTGKMIIGFYKLWHGILKQKGAGRLLTTAAHRCKSLQNHRMILPEGHCIDLDFRDVSAMYWLNHTLGDPFEESGLLTAMRNFLNSQSVVWDIGANSGLLSYHIARDLPFLELHLFEPNPQMIQLAAQAVSVFSETILHPFGLSNQEGGFCRRWFKTGFFAGAKLDRFQREMAENRGPC